MSYCITTIWTCPAQIITHRHVERRLPVSGVQAVILSAAKDLCVRRARPFAALRVTGLLSTCLNYAAVPPLSTTSNALVLKLSVPSGWRVPVRIVYGQSQRPRGHLTGKCLLRASVSDHSHRLRVQV